MKRSLILDGLRRLLIGVCVVHAACSSKCTAQDNRNGQTAHSIRLEENSSKTGVDVYIASSHFATYLHKGFGKPILYPIYATDGIGITRNWPMQDAVVGEMRDHPHHKSMWVGHIINGVDFWTEKGGRVEMGDFTLDEKKASLHVTSNWFKKDSEQPLLSDLTIYSFGAEENVRWIDVSIRFSSETEDLHFEDTKEGTFAIRTHPHLQLTPSNEEADPTKIATARNSSGDTGKSIWGKKAKWVLYQGVIDQKPIALAILDHPDNLRHPTTWHARDYGLVAANQFGLHEFQGGPVGAGAYIVKRGDALSLRYRTLFIVGEPTDEMIETWYGEFLK
jgi:hypothetical protein